MCPFAELAAREAELLKTATETDETADADEETDDELEAAFARELLARLFAW